VRFKPSAFPELTNVSPARWARLSGLIAVAFRPPNRLNNSFADHGFIPLSPGPTMFVMRWQYVLDEEKLQRSVILQALKFCFNIQSGRIYADAKLNPECSAAAYDCALPRSRWSPGGHHLDPNRNKTAADLVIYMSREANRVIEAKEPIPHQPILPEFYLAFGRRPTFERSDVLVREASDIIGKAPGDIPDAELEEFFWAQTFESGDYVLVPQRYLARQGEYPVHPLDGSVRPEMAGEPGQWDGLWYFGDGRWNAAAQRPETVYVHMGTVLGRPFRNPAFTVLKASSFFPADMTYPQFMAIAEAQAKSTAKDKVLPIIAGLHQRLSDALAANSTVITLLVTEIENLMGRTRDMATEEDLLRALDRPDLPMTLSFATGVRMVRYSGLPRPESLTWQVSGGHVDLYSVKEPWADKVAPAAGRPEGSSHGRVSPSFGN
jgi:hypothetical protein